MSSAEVEEKPVLPADNQKMRRFYLKVNARNHRLEKRTLYINKIQGVQSSSTSVCRIYFKKKGRAAHYFTALEIMKKTD